MAGCLSAGANGPVGYLDWQSPRGRGDAAVAGGGGAGRRMGSRTAAVPSSRAAGGAVGTVASAATVCRTAEARRAVGAAVATAARPSLRTSDTAAVGRWKGFDRRGPGPGGESPGAVTKIQKDKAASNVQALDAKGAGGPKGEVQPSPGEISWSSIQGRCTWLCCREHRRASTRL